MDGMEFADSFLDKVDDGEQRTIARSARAALTKRSI